MSDKNPTPAALAQIAAHFLPQCGDTAAAAKQAKQLWDACAIECGHVPHPGRSPNKFKESVLAALPVVPLPKKFPATLDDFYTVIVKGKTKSASGTRFAQFIRWQMNRQEQQQHLAPAGTKLLTFKQRIASYRILDEDAWRTLAIDYLQWWRNLNKDKKRTAGAIGGKKRKKLNPHAGGILPAINASTGSSGMPA